MSEHSGEVLDAMDSIRSRLVGRARGEVGQGDVNSYWRSALGPGAKPPWPKHWCGAFCLAMLHAEGLGLDEHWAIGRGFLYRLQRTQEPQPGDVAYFNRFQHHALVGELTGETLHTIDGNQGQPSPVALRSRPIKAAVAFYSIEPWLLEAVERSADAP